jgi:hypothetical protein
VTPEQNPFEALGLPARPDLTDEQVRAAWRAIAAATHPDRADGGDLAAYTAASAAYAELRTPWARSEAYADLTERAARSGYEPDTSPLPVIGDPGSASPPPPWQPLLAVWQLPARIRRGRPLHLAIRAIVAALLSLAVLRTIPDSPAAPADVSGLVLWFVLRGRRDLAPPPER